MEENGQMWFGMVTATVCGVIFLTMAVLDNNVWWGLLGGLCLAAGNVFGIEFGKRGK